MDSILIRALIIGLLTSLFSFFIWYSKTHEKKIENTVCYPKLFLIVGIVGSIMFLIPTIITAVLGLHVLLPIGFLFFSLLGGVVIIAYINCKIYYTDDTIIVQNFFRKSRTYKFVEITALKFATNGTYIYFGKKRIGVDNLCRGGEDLIRCAQAKYRELHGVPIPCL